MLSPGYTSNKWPWWIFSTLNISSYMSWHFSHPHVLLLWPRCRRWARFSSTIIWGELCKWNSDWHPPWKVLSVKGRQCPSPEGSVLSESLSWTPNQPWPATAVVLSLVCKHHPGCSLQNAAIYNVSYPCPQATNPQLFLLHVLYIMILLVSPSGARFSGNSGIWRKTNRK